jgi:hypothetical protein
LEVAHVLLKAQHGHALTTRVKAVSLWRAALPRHRPLIAPALCVHRPHAALAPMPRFLRCTFSSALRCYRAALPLHTLCVLPPVCTTLACFAPLLFSPPPSLPGRLCRAVAPPLPRLAVPNREGIQDTCHGRCLSRIAPPTMAPPSAAFVRSCICPRSCSDDARPTGGVLPLLSHTLQQASPSTCCSKPRLPLPAFTRCSSVNSRVNKL